MTDQTMLSHAAETLERARAKIEVPSKLYQGPYMYQAANGSRGSSGDPIAAYSVIGAIRIQSKDGQDDVAANIALDRLLAEAHTHHNTVTRWSDDPATTHAEILAAFDRAIASLRSELS